jgi:hypothetical protein
MKHTPVYILMLIRMCNAYGQQVLDTLGNASLKREDSTNLKIARLNINSNSSDFSPFMVKGQLLFVSGRDRNGAVQYVDNSNASEITDIYVSTCSDSINFKNVSCFDTPINSKYYEGPFCFNREGTVLYFTKTDALTGALKIYRSENSEGKWSKPEMLPFCEKDLSYCHPALAPGDTKLVFASNLNKKNKMDLFMSEYENGVWSPPLALNAKINDTSNQVFPFINSNSVLYFASNKAGGKGGLDIYTIDLKYDTSLVRALPSPINSPFDDFGIWIDADTKTGYFSSDRNKRYKDDIYYFGNKIPEFDNWKKMEPKSKFCYTFFEERLASTETANTVFEWDFGDGKKGKGLKTKHCYDKPGKYLVKLNTVDNISGEVFTNETSSTLVIEKPNKLVLDCSESITEGQDLLIRTDNCYLKGCVVDKMYWSFGDGKYNYGSLVKHRYSAPGNYRIQVGLVARDTVSNKLERYKIEKTIIVMKKN